MSKKNKDRVEALYNIHTEAEPKLQLSSSRLSRQRVIRSGQLPSTNSSQHNTTSLSTCGEEPFTLKLQITFIFIDFVMSARFLSGPSCARYWANSRPLMNGGLKKRKVREGEI